MSLVKNTALLTGASIVQKAIAFLYFAFLARMLGSHEALGTYALALTTITTVAILADIGMTSVVIREISRDKKTVNDMLRTVFAWKCVTIPLTIMVAWVFPVALHLPDAVVVLARLAIPVIIADTISVTLYGVLRAFGNLAYESFGMLTGQMFTVLIGTATFFAAGGDLRWLIFALVVGSLWNLAFSLYRVARVTGWSAMKPAFVLGKTPVLMGSMFFLSAICVKLYSSIDAFTIHRVLGTDDVGVYSVAYKMAYAFQFIPLAFVGALYPAMSAAHHDREELKKLFLHAQWYMTLFGCAVVFGLISVAQPMIRVFYGGSYAAAAWPLQLLLLGVLCIFYDFPVGSLLNALRKQHEKTAIMVITMAINAVGNLLLIPIFGLAGAGYTAIITFVAMYALGLWRITRCIDGFLGELALLHVQGGVAGVVMYVVVSLLLPWLPLPLTIILGGFTFLLIAFLLRLLKKDHLYALRLVAKF